MEYNCIWKHKEQDLTEQAIQNKLEKFSRVETKNTKMRMKNDEGRKKGREWNKREAVMKVDGGD